MFVVTRVKKRVLKIIIISAILIVICSVLETSLPSNLIAVQSNEVGQYDHTTSQTFLKNYGWEIDPVPIETVKLEVPSHFNDVWHGYNDLQLSQGFDLRTYQGKTLTRYTYLVKNHPTKEDGVRVNILTYKNEIVGGDICTVALNGFMHGFEVTKATS